MMGGWPARLAYAKLRTCVKNTGLHKDSTMPAKMRHLSGPSWRLSKPQSCPPGSGGRSKARKEHPAPMSAQLGLDALEAQERGVGGQKLRCR